MVINGSKVHEIKDRYKNKTIFKYENLYVGVLNKVWTYERTDSRKNIYGSIYFSILFYSQDGSNKNIRKNINLVGTKSVFMNHEHGSIFNKTN